MRATYRIQLGPDFTFAQAAERCGYLAQLGVDTLYLSPIFEAVPGSAHGYDVTDPRQVRVELGGEEGYARLVEAARGRGLSVLVDIVPNHMAATPDNPYWWDLMAHGPVSRHARLFCVDWSRGRLVLPILGESPAAAALEVTAQSGQPILRYHDQCLPLRPDGPRMVPGRYAGRELEPLLAAQHYELAYWRDGLKRLNYRRFFDISTLVTLRQEDPWVFDYTHAGLARLCEVGLVDGVRVDHVDGLRDPKQYLVRLRHLIGDRTLLVEKILTGDETLPHDWPVDGTTGYEFGATMVQLLVPAAGYRRLARHGETEHRDYAESLVRAREKVAGELFPAEVERLVAVAAALPGAPPADRLRPALIAVSARLPVYRTYGDATGLPPSDRRRIETAVGAARGACDGPTLDWLLNTLLHGSTHQACEFRMDWQQLTAPMMAKGGEDTAHYRHVVLAAMNEVGAHPHAPADDPARLHRRLARQPPAALNATATHDTKRGEDTRVRIAVIAQHPGPYLDLEERLGSGWEALRATDARLLLQSLLGILGYDDDAAVTERLAEYAEKALREAKRESHWYRPNVGYESIAAEAVETLLAGALRPTVRAVATHYATAGVQASLVQTTIKLTAPGVPDFYQGAELWDDSLVDPDNRRVVDFDLRQRLLADLPPLPMPAQTLASWLRHWSSGRIKLWLIHRLLQLRATWPALFAEGEYQPVALPDGWFGFDRQYRRATVRVLVRCRYFHACPGALDLGDDEWQQQLMAAPAVSGTCELERLAGPLPVAVLMRGSA